MYISILIATYKRPELLRKELESFCVMDMAGFIFEVLIADNADDSETRKVVELFYDKLPVKYFVENKPGKNAALNRIITEAKGKIFIFTDDDIIVDKGWLREIYAGVQRWPSYAVFGGKILPYNSEIIPEEFKMLKGYSYLYGVADWDDEEGVYDAANVYGANMVVRSEIFKNGSRFNESIFTPGDGYIPASETEFLLRLGKFGHKTVYLPKALVHHQIRNEQCHWDWVIQRGFGEGMRNAWFERDFKGAVAFRIPRYLFRVFFENFFACLTAWCFRNPEYKQRRYDLEVVKGTIFQFWKQGGCHE